MKSIVCLGVHVLDVHVRQVESIPTGSEGALVDEIRMSPAGTAGGTAVVLAKLGARAQSMGAIGTDALGATLAGLLSENGVDTSGLVRRHDTQTSASVLPLRGDGDRPAWHCIGANGTLTEDDIDLAAIRAADHVHIGGPEFFASTAVTVLKAAKDAGATTSIDMLAPGMPEWIDVLSDCLSLTDFFLPNDEQLLALTGKSTLEDAALAMLNHGVGCVAVTAGARGAYVASAEGGAWAPAFAIDVVDTTGCGDSFSAGFLLGRSLGRSPLEAAILGNATAAHVAQGLATDFGSYDLASVDAFAATAATR